MYFCRLCVKSKYGETEKLRKRHFIVCIQTDDVYKDIAEDV